MDTARTIAARDSAVSWREPLRRALAAAFAAGLPMIAVAQAAPEPAAASSERESVNGSLHALLPASVYLQGGVAEHVDTYSLGVLWMLPWQHDFSFGRLATSAEASVGEWQTHGQRRHTRPFTQIGFTPTLRFYPGAWHGHWFVEAGVGANVIAPAYHTDGKRFSTQFNFGDHVGIGREFGPSHRHELALRVEHFSNAGIDHPNPGENFVQVRWVVHF
jgi:hypothetical protein